MFVYIMDGVESTLNLSNNRVIVSGKLSRDYRFCITGKALNRFSSPYILRNDVKLTFVDFNEESTSISVKSTFDTSSIETDTRFYQYSCEDLIKWQEKSKILVQA